jgi:beta-glucosidase
MRFVVEPGTVEVMVGSSSDDVRLTGEFEITGEAAEINTDETYSSKVNVH